ncbi:MAG: hypothetical protein M0Q13_13265 [Methanothrix sp.]|nr:hypothetical protein [Methanothrix sp.]
MFKFISSLWNSIVNMFSSITEFEENQDKLSEILWGRDNDLITDLYKGKELIESNKDNKTINLKEDGSNFSIVTEENSNKCFAEGEEVRVKKVGVKVAKRYLGKRGIVECIFFNDDTGINLGLRMNDRVSLLWVLEKDVEKVDK